MNMGQKLTSAAIRLYQKSISPFLPPRCRFHPSCSEYAVRAVEKHGAWKGGAYGLLRLVKCHPWHPGGEDPVP